MKRAPGFAAWHHGAAKYREWEEKQEVLIIMSARTPEEMPRLWAETFVADDLDALVALYEADAILVAQPGEVVTGIEIGCGC